MRTNPVVGIALIPSPSPACGRREQGQEAAWEAKPGGFLLLESASSIGYTIIKQGMECMIERPRLLLHICCGPCATVALEHLRETFAVTGYYGNANIHPETEYRLRLDAAREAAGRYGIPLAEGPYEPERFDAAVRGFEQEPENGGRCPLCYRFRLEEAAAFAAANGFEFFASTLTTGPQKKAAVINPIGVETGIRRGVKFLERDWKKRDGFRRSCELARSFGLYRQHYCGCRFSVREDSPSGSHGDIGPRQP